MLQSRSVLTGNRAQKLFTDAPRRPKMPRDTPQYGSGRPTTYPQEARKRCPSWVTERDMVPANTHNTRKALQDAPKTLPICQTGAPHPQNHAKHGVCEFGLDKKWSYVIIKIGSQLDIMLMALEIARVFLKLIGIYEV